MSLLSSKCMDSYGRTSKNCNTESICPLGRRPVTLFSTSRDPSCRTCVWSGRGKVWESGSLVIVSKSGTKNNITTIPWIPGMMAHVCNPRYSGSEAVQGQPREHNISWTRRHGFIIPAIGRHGKKDHYQKAALSKNTRPHSKTSNNRKGWENDTSDRMPVYQLWGPEFQHQYHQNRNYALTLIRFA
jgi:hypothetical protein